VKIGELAATVGVSTDTLRFYEKQGLLPSPLRAPSGYRSYGQEHLERMRFVRSAQALGFSLAQIAEILPNLAAGRFVRAEIEQQLRTKVDQIDAQMRALRLLKRDLLATFGKLTCSRDAQLSAPDVTAESHGAPRRVGRARRIPAAP
jgi:DNA-binding transcriptional MerR regulator